MYRYLLLTRGRSVCPPPRWYVWSAEYPDRRYFPEYGVWAWGEFCYKDPLDSGQAANCELYYCGYVDAVVD